MNPTLSYPYAWLPVVVLVGAVVLVTNVYLVLAALFVLLLAVLAALAAAIVWVTYTLVGYARRRWVRL